MPPIIRPRVTDLARLIDNRVNGQFINVAKREVHTLRRGETIPSSLIQKEDADGASEAE